MLALHPQSSRDWVQSWPTGRNVGFPMRCFRIAGRDHCVFWRIDCGSPATDLVKFFGEGFWSLIPFTMANGDDHRGRLRRGQFAAVYRLIRWLANIPTTPRGAVAFVALVSTSTSLISYGFSLIFAAFWRGKLRGDIRRGLSRARRGGVSGLGSVWALGLSSSAALLMATKTAMPPALLKISSLIPLSQTIYSWQSILTAIILLIVAVTVAYFSAPTGKSVRTAESFGVSLEPMIKEIEPRRTPGECSNTRRCSRF